MIKATLRDEAFKLRLKNGRMTSPWAPDQAAMQIATPRNDYAAVQLLLSADEAVSVCLTDAPHFSQVLGAYRLRIQAEGPLRAELFELGMMTDDDGSLAADILLPSDSFEIADGMPRAVYCRFWVPQGTEPGLYKQRLGLYGSGLFGAEQLLDSFEVTVEVAGATLPQRPSFRLDLWQHNANIARHHDVRLWSDEHFSILERYIGSLAALGQSSATVVASEIPWRGQSCYNFGHNLFEYTMIRIEWGEEKGWHYDFSVMDRYLALCEAAGIADEIEVFGLASVWHDAPAGFTGPVAGDIASPRLRYWNRDTRIWCWVEDAGRVDEYILALAAHFRATGRMDRVRIASDEPADPEAYAACIARLKGLAPDFRFKTAINHAEFVGRFHDSIDVFAPFIYCVSAEWDKLAEYRAAYPDKTFLWYHCCGPSYLNTFLRCHLLETRYIGVLTALMGLDGFLRWNYTVWPTHPRQDIRFGTFAAGDVNFVYPGGNGAPLLSLRYEQLRRGIGDFELITLARKRGLHQAVEAFFACVVRERDVRRFFPEPEGEIRPANELCSLNHEDYAAARQALLRALDAAGG